MRTLIPALFAILLLLPIKAFPDDKAELVSRLVSLDGTQQQLGSLQRQMLDGVAPYQKKLSEEDYALLRKSIEVNFESDKLFENYKAVIAGQIGTELLKGAIKWFETPFARRISELQTKSASVEGVKEMAEFRSALVKKPAAASRAKLIEELDATLKATDLFVDLAVNMSEGIAIGVLSIQSGITEGQINGLRQKMSAMRQQIRPQIKKNTTINNLFTYRSISDDELRELTGFYRSPIGKALIEASFYALNDSLQKASEQVGREVGAVRQSMQETAKKKAK